MRKRIIVIGGGMAGTSAAHALTKLGYDVTIVEKNERLGGRVRSEMHDGVAVEYGAGFITNMYPNLLRFLKERGFSERLCRYHAIPGVFRDGKVYIASLQTVFSGKLLSLRALLVLPLSLIKPLLHWKSFDPRHPERLATYDSASVADHYTSKTGKELLDHVVQPILTATFYWLPDVAQRTSEAMLLFCAKALVLGGTYIFRGGLQRIPEALAEGSTVLLEHAVSCVERMGDGTYSVTTQTGNEKKVLTADGIVCATTATVVPRILSDLTATQRSFFKEARYSSVSYLGRTYKKEDVRGNRSIIFPAASGSTISGITALRQPKAGTSKSSVAWIKVCAAGEVDKDEDDRAKILAEGAQPAHEALFIGNPEPLSTITWHWEESLPVFETGYFKRLTVFLEGEAASTEPLAFAGDYIGGPFMEGAYTSGMLAAERLDRILNSRGT